jgi:hypothetical protein
MRVPAHQNREAEQKGRGASPNGDALRPVRSQGHKKPRRGAAQTPHGSQVLDLAGESRYGFPLFSRKEAQPGCSKSNSVPGASAFLFPKGKGLDSKQKVK